MKNNTFSKEFWLYLLIFIAIYSFNMLLPFMVYKTGGIGF